MIIDVIEIKKPCKLVLDDDILRMGMKSPMDFFQILYEAARLGGEYEEEFEEVDFGYSRKEV